VRERLTALGLIAAVAACGGSPSDETGVLGRYGTAGAAISVEEAIDAGCSTTQVAGLSLQIIAQVNCNNPDAYAELSGSQDVTFGNAVLPYMQEPARDALQRAIDDNAGTALQLNSMLRTVAQQYLLYQWFLSGSCGVAAAAAPSGSNHESGLAVDVQQYATWQSLLEAEGFSWLGTGDPVHFHYAGMGVVDLGNEGVLAFQELWNLNHPEDLIGADGLYGPQTEARLTMAPGEGFAEGAVCGDLPMNGAMISATVDDGSDLFDDGVSAGVVDLFVGAEHEVVVTVVGGAGDTLEVTLPDALELLEVDGDASSSDSEVLVTLPSGASAVVTLTVLAAVSNVDQESPEPIEIAVGSSQAELPIDVYERRAWRFESSRLEGWTSDATGLESVGGELRVEGDGPLWVQTSELQVGSLPGLTLEATSNATLSLWWTTAAAPDYDAARSLPLELPDGGALVLGADELSAVKGTITGLRVVADGSTDVSLAIDSLLLDGENSDPTPVANADEGCGCHQAGGPTNEAPWWMALALLAFRRRRV
jgi:MYXO-CTERM domain-containing protein